jgi:hypothetical protein
MNDTTMEDARKSKKRPEQITSKRAKTTETKQTYQDHQRFEKLHERKIPGANVKRSKKESGDRGA